MSWNRIRIYLDYTGLSLKLTSPMGHVLGSQTSQKGYPLSKRIEVVGAVFVQDGKILACKRGETMSLPGYWEFPGGKIEEGESPEQALRRELDEELNCRATVGDHLDTTAHEYDFGTVVLSTYICELGETDPILAEHEEMRWLTPSELRSVEWAPADLPAVALLESGLL
ncbi:CTP pyrophosphohydrolase [Corynebacterium auriscanis]|nr:CTP pyrophosphohydrolase [Corynebacterium auriscanis]